MAAGTARGMKGGHWLTTERGWCKAGSIMQVSEGVYCKCVKTRQNARARAYRVVHLQDVRRSRRALRRGQGVLPPAGSRAETACQPTTSPEVARGSMAIGGAVSVAAVRHMHSTVERETDQLKNTDANLNIVVSADGCVGRNSRHSS